MHEKKHYRIICEEQLKAADPDDETPELDLGKGFTDLEMYHDLMRSARLLSLVGRKPQEFMSEEADFLFGCPLRYEIFTDDEIDAIRFDPNVEAADDRTYYYIWIIFGAFDEVKMAAKVDSERGTVHPLPFIPVQSEYEHFYHSKDRKFLTSSERNILIDRIFYPILIPDEIVTKSKDEEKIAMIMKMIHLNGMYLILKISDRHMILPTMTVTRTRMMRTVTRIQMMKIIEETYGTIRKRMTRKIRTVNPMMKYGMTHMIKRRSILKIGKACGCSVKT